MANKKIKDLPAAAALNGLEAIPADQGTSTVNITVQGLSNYAIGSNDNLASMAAAISAANKLFYFTGAGTGALADFSPYGRSLVASIDEASARTTLNAAKSGANSDISSITGSAAKLTTARTIAFTGDATGSGSFDGSANYSAALTLAASGVTAGTYGTVTVNAKGLVTAGTAATPIANGGTGAITAATARTALGVVFNTWANLSLQNSWVVISGRRAAYRSFLDMVQLELQISGGTATDSTLLATLPAGFRPAFPITVPVASPPNTTPTTTIGGPRVTIGTDGTIICVNCTNVQIAASIIFATV